MPNRNEATRQPILGLIHTVASLVETFDRLVLELGATMGVVAQHMVDEALLATTRRDGLTKETMRHLLAYALASQESGADVVLVTCSSLGQAVGVVAPLMDIPVLRVDEAMVHRALVLGRRIGVLATLESTLSPTVELIETEARRLGPDLALDVRLCSGAFDAARRGEPERHDALILTELRSLLLKVDVVVLAQASMARALTGLDPSDARVPILTSPRLAVERAVDELSAITASRALVVGTAPEVPFGTPLQTG